MTESEQQLVQFIRAIPGWVRMQIVFLDSKMEHARFHIADALEKEINAKLKVDQPAAALAPSSEENIYE